MEKFASPRMRITNKMSICAESLVVPLHLISASELTVLPELQNRKNNNKKYRNWKNAQQRPGSRIYGPYWFNDNKIRAGS